MTLDTYHAKRRFDRTAEPAGGEARARGGPPQFVVHAHDATRMHWDLRLELDGVLKSWAVPKGPSLDPGDRRLAVETEDHPMAYATFEGVIAEGEYGGGPTLVWDRGAWFPDGDDPAGDLAAGKLTFRLDGEKLRGGFRLIRTKKAGKAQQWLLMKREDERAERGGEAIVAARPESVLTGRTLAEVEAAGVGRTAGDAPLGEAAAVPGAEEAALPEVIAPALATLVTAPPSRGGPWLAEVKLDGYRLLARKAGGEVRLLTRSGRDWTGRFPRIAAAVGALPVEEAALDGEIVVLDAQGRPDFGALQQAIGGDDGAIVYTVFDLLFEGGRDLRGAPLRARKEALRFLLAGAAAPLRFGDHVASEELAAFQREVCALGLEGAVYKRADAPYRAGRTRDWLKVKCRGREELVVIGFTAPSGRRRGLGALLLATREAEGAPLVYAGKVGTGFSARTLGELRRRLEPLAREPNRPAIEGAPREKGATWVAPELVAEVTHGGWTKDGVLRHASFEGLREDKAARDVVRERAASEDGGDGEEDGTMASATGHEAAQASAKAKTKTKATSAGRRGAREATMTSSGVRLTHPDRVLYPAVGLTKEDLVRYVERVSERMLPTLAGRPLSLVRCPQGVDGQCFYQKGEGNAAPKAVGRVDVGEDAPYLMVEDAASAVGLVQMDVVEMHVWGARAADLEHPDLVVLDLDPGPKVPWRRVAATALVLRELLLGVGLAAFARMTGGKGVHVVAPIAPTRGWKEVKGFTHDIARSLVRSAPSHYTDKVAKEGREGKILVDYLRNARGATAVATWSPRQHADAPVAWPIPWEALSEERETPPKLTVAEVLADGLPERDPWAGFDEARRELTWEAMKQVAEAAKR